MVKTEEFCRVCGKSSYDDCRFLYTSKHGSNLCNKHYLQLERHGKIKQRTSKDENEIILHDKYAEVIMYSNYGEKKNGSFFIDLEDIALVRKYRWCLRQNRPGTRVSKDETKFIHQILIDYDKSKYMVDHIDRNPMNNRRSNLRICKAQDNTRNSSISKNNNSGVTGVFFRKNRNKWIAYIGLDYGRKNLGSFSDKNEAVRARLEAEKKYFKEFAPQQHLYEQYGIK